MRLLFATSIVPDGALTSGYEIANAAVIDSLRRAGADVTIMGFIWPGRKPSDPDTITLGELEVRTDAVSLPQKLKWLAGAVMSGLPVASAKLKVLSEHELRTRIKAAGPFDGYVLNAAPFAGAFESVFTDLPSVLVAHNVEHVSAQENAAAARDTFQRAVYAREARALKDMERRLCRNSRFVYTLAEEDRVALGVATDDRSAMLPLVTNASPQASLNRSIACDAALIGTWSWQPNRIGLDWFLEKVVPHLPQDFTVQIAGHMPGDVTSPHPGVKFVGRVPDAQEFVLSAAAIPLVSQAGTGVQLKTIEAFELGLPTVATTRSLRGIDYRPSNCTAVDDPKAFAEALIETARKRSSAIDGSVFKNRQTAALDAGIARGLRALASGSSTVRAA